MKVTYLILIALFTFGTASCHSQNTKNMQEEQNPLLCNPEIGICEIPGGNSETDSIEQLNADKKPVKIIYFTDPICSSCWGIEPQLRKLKLEYGNSIEIEYRMGGLLKDWSYNSGGISKPSDVAHHWDEVSLHYDMPIDGDVWLTDPLNSSYPPSIAFKAAQLQDNEKAILFLREVREMVFLKKLNITKWEHMEVAAKNVGLNTVQFKIDYEGKAVQLFNEDLLLARELGVRGFPTMIFINSNGERETVYGTKPYIVFENTLLKMHPTAIKTNYDTTWHSIFCKYNSLTAKEFSELTGTLRTDSDRVLNELKELGRLEKLTTKNGSIWTLKKK